VTRVVGRCGDRWCSVSSSATDSSSATRSVAHLAR
jgi:hypothetical protein